MYQTFCERSKARNLCVPTWCQSWQSSISLSYTHNHLNVSNKGVYIFINKFRCHLVFSPIILSSFRYTTVLFCLNYNLVINIDIWTPDCSLIQKHYSGFYIFFYFVHEVTCKPLLNLVMSVLNWWYKSI